MVATLERTETRMRPVLTIHAQGGISQARVSASAAGLGQLTTIARGTPDPNAPDADWVIYPPNQ